MLHSEVYALEGHFLPYLLNLLHYPFAILLHHTHLKGILDVAYVPSSVPPNVLTVQGLFILSPSLA